MRLAFWRTEKPVARPVLQPGADSPYVPREGVWMMVRYDAIRDTCMYCGGPNPTNWVLVTGEKWFRNVHEGCKGARPSATSRQLQREARGETPARTGGMTDAS